jgi:hypothetical protein
MAKFRLNIKSPPIKLSGDLKGLNVIAKGFSPGKVTNNLIRSPEGAASLEPTN